MSDNKLGAFLRIRREAVTPTEVGLAGGTRRRTPGLRRAELATLAGASVDYLVRLEQGRDRHPSAQVLAALADVLGLSAGERVHLPLLAKAAGGDGQLLCPAAQAPVRSVRPTVLALLDRLEPAPALVVIGCARCSPTPAAMPGWPALLVSWTPSHPASAGLCSRPPGPGRLPRMGPHRRPAGRQPQDRVLPRRPACRAAHRGADHHRRFLVHRRLQAPPTLPNASGIERLVHPAVGELRLAYETLELPDADDQRLVVYLPADHATTAALDQLTGRQPGALRAVTG